MEMVARALHSLFGRIRIFLNGKTTVKQTLPPYILIGVLWFLSTASDEQERAEEKIEAAINIAEIEYVTDLQLRAQALDIRQDCIDDVNGRNNTIANWHNLFEFLRAEGFDEFTARLEADFNSRPRNQRLTVEQHCAEFPVPAEVTIPRILIEEGIVEE